MRDYSNKNALQTLLESRRNPDGGSRLIYINSSNDILTSYQMRFDNVWTKELINLRAIKPSPTEIKKMQTLHSIFVKAAKQQESCEIYNPAEILKYIDSFKKAETYPKNKDLFKLKAINQTKEFNKKRISFGKDVYERIYDIDKTVGIALTKFPILFSLHVAPIFHFGYTLNEDGKDYKVCLNLFFKSIFFFKLNLIFNLNYFFKLKFFFGLYFKRIYMRD